MEVAEAHEVQVDKAGSGFAETQESPASEIHEHPRTPVDPDDVAR